MVKLLNGNIKIKSTPGEGSTFIIKFPLGKNNLSEIGKTQNGTIISEYNHLAKPEIISSPVNENISISKKSNIESQKLILLVEDDIEILNFLDEELSSEYKVLKAKNGDEGWKLIFERIPDLVVSDIIMPGINGLELCKKIKRTLETNHIPVILLTAKTLVEHEIQGLETGADDYIHKPFHPRLLKLKIKRIIEAKEAIKERFEKNKN